MNGESYAQNYEYARTSIDMALGRGGDQAVVKDSDKILYYGGNRLVLINRDETPYDGYANLIFREPIGQVLGQCVNGESL